jgi:hypothetical protein
MNVHQNRLTTNRGVTTLLKRVVAVGPLQCAGFTVMYPSWLHFHAFGIAFRAYERLRQMTHPLSYFPVKK